MPRSSPPWPSRCADGRSDSSEYSGSFSEAGGGEEKCTTVAIRLRPLNERENAGKQKKIWRCVPTHNSITQTSPDGNPLPDTKGSTFFTYDRIFDEDSTTQEVYEGVARDIVHSVVRGLNGTIFAYGQTSSGKTFTMQGGDDQESPGIVQLAAHDLFQQMEEAPDRMFLMRVSYLEIYQEDIKDLLNPESSKLQVREDPRKGVYIEAHEKVVSDFDNVLKILSAGEKQRHVECTEMNNRSSRSHTIFRLVVESQEHYVPGIHASPEDVDPAVLVATLNLVDLAGSESVRHTGATGMRQKEGGKINQSLLTLSRVIQTLSQARSAHVNYRDSKLTRILQPSLSGNAGMAIICCATPAEGYLEETRSTLQFASRAKQIKTCAMVNEVVDDKAQLRRVSRELAALKRQQAEGESGSALVETLQAQKAEQAAKIERLKNLLINLAPVNKERELHLTVSPRYRRTKRSRETWCPGEGGVPLSLLDGNNPSASGMNIEKSRKRRSNASVDISTSRGSAKMKSPQTPLVSREDGNTTAPGFMSPARARAQQDVDTMREKLSALQAERDAKAEAAEEEIRRVKQLEAVVTEREQEVLLLKEQLDAASKVAAGERVEAITAQLAEATKAKDALEQELNEFVEVTGKKTMVLEEKMVAMNEILQKKETELSAIRAAEEEEKARNASRVQELENQVEELEAAIEDRGLAIAEMGASGPGAAKEEDELAGLKVVLEACQNELAEHQTRADGAEAELKELVEELSSTKARLDEERDSAEGAAQEAANAVEAASAAAEAASRREREVTSESQERISALEAEKASLQEQEAELRARSADAAEQLTVQEELLTSVAKDDAAQKAVADAQGEVEKRDYLLAGLQSRVGELEGNLAEAIKEKQELVIRMKEEKLRADETVINALTAKKRAERGLGIAYDSRDELRFRLEEATLQAQEAEAAREHMAKASTTIKLKKKIAALEEQVSEGIDHLRASEETVIAAENFAEGARWQLANSKASCELKDAKIDELIALVKRLEADGDKSAQLEEDWEILHGKHEMVLSEKQKLEEELAVARMDAEELGAKVQALFDNDRYVEVLSAELSAAKASASEAQALASAEISRLAEEVTTSKDQTTAVQSQLEAKTQEVLTLRADAEDFSVRLSAVEKAATERKVADVARIALVEDRLTEALVAAEKMATEAMEAKQKVATVHGLVSELKGVREALEAREMEIADVASKHKVEVEHMRIALERAETSATVKEEEVSSLRQQAAFEVSEAQSKADGLASELESLRRAMEVSKKEMADVASKLEAETEKIRADLERAEALATAKDGEVTSLQQQASKEASEAQTKSDDLAMDLKSLREALEASNKETASVASKYEVAMEDIRSSLKSAEVLATEKEKEVAEAQAKLEDLLSELEIVREALEASRKESASFAPEYDRAKALVTVIEKEIASLQQQAAHELSEAHAKVDDLSLELERTRKALEASEKEMSNIVSKHQTDSDDIRSKLERAEAFATENEREVADIWQQAGYEVLEAQAKSNSLALELKSVREALGARKEEMAEYASKHETETATTFAALENAKALVTAMEGKVAYLQQQAAQQSCEAQAKVGDLASELERVREALMMSVEDAASVASRHEAETKHIRAELERAETLAAAKEEEIASLKRHAAHEVSEARDEADGLATELESVREALEANEKEMTEVASRHEAETKDIHADLERAETLVREKEGEIASLHQQATHDVSAAQAKANGLASELESVREALEASEKKVADVASKHEAETEKLGANLERAEALATAKERDIANLQNHVAHEVSKAKDKADSLATELKSVCEALEANEKEMSEVASRHEAETKDIHADLERAETLVREKEGEIASLHQQATHDVYAAQAQANGLASELESVREALEASEKEITELASRHEAETKDIHADLERAETLARAKEGDIASLYQQAAHEVSEAQAKTKDLASELESVRESLEANEKEMAEVASKHEVAEALATAKEEEIASLKKRAADEISDAQARADGLAIELESVHKTLEASEKEIAEVASRHEAKTEKLRADLGRAETLVRAKEGEIASLQQKVAHEVSKAQSQANGLVSELECVHEVLEASKKEMAGISSKLEVAEALATVKEEEIASLQQQAAHDVSEAQTKANGLVSEVENFREALEASEKEIADVASMHEVAKALVTAKEVEVANLQQHLAHEVSEAQAKADGLATELESVREALEASEKEMAGVASRHEAETEKLRADLELAEALATAKEVEVANLQQQLAHDASEAQSKADGLATELESVREALEASEKEMAGVASRHEAETEKLRADLELAEALATAKEVEVANLQQQLAHDASEAQSKADGLATELESVREALEASEKEMARVASRHEAETEKLRADLELAKALATAKEVEVANLQQKLAHDASEAQSKADGLATELESVREALEASEKEMTDVASNLELAEALATAKEGEVASLQHQVAHEVSEAQANTKGLATELESVREALEASEKEMADIASKLEVAEALATAKEGEVANLQKQFAHEVSDAQARADGLATELECVRDALEASEKGMADVASRHETETEKLRADLGRAETLVRAKEGEIASLQQKVAHEVSKEQSQANGLALELECVHDALEASKKEMTEISSKLEVAEALATVKEEEIASLQQQAAHDVSEAQTKVNGLVSEVENFREALEASEKEIADVASMHEVAKALVTAKEVEVANLQQHLAHEVSEAQAKADGLATELENVREALEASEKEMAGVASRHEAETEKLRADLELAEALATAKEVEVANLQQQLAHDASEAQSKADGLATELESVREALEASEKEMAGVASRHEAETEKLRADLELAEALATAKEVEVANLQQQLAHDASEAQSKADGLATELESVREALEASEKEMTDVASKLELAEALATAKEGEVASLQHQVAHEVSEAQAKTKGLATELESVREALEASEKEMADIASKLEVAEALATAKEGEVANLQKQFAHEVSDAQARADGLATELECVRDALEASEKGMADIASKDEGEIVELRADLERTEMLARAKEEEIASLKKQAAHEISGALDKAGSLTSELEILREALEESKNEATSVSLKYKVATEDIRAALERAEALATAKEEEVARLLQQIDELKGAQSTLEEANETVASKDQVIVELNKRLEVTKTDLVEAIDDFSYIASELETVREALEASEGEAASVAAKHEVETSEIRAVLERAEGLAMTKEEEVASLRQQAAHQLCEAKTKADGFASELEIVRDALDVCEKEMVEVASKHEAETEDIRAALERAKAFATAKEEEVAGLLQQNADDLRKARATMDAANASVSTKDDVIAELNKRLESNEAVEIDLAQALRDSEDLSKQVLDLTDQVVEKERTMAKLRQELDSVSLDLTALKEQRTSFAADNSNASIADTKAELRRLKVELDMKGSKMDTLLKENVLVHAELKEMKGMFNAAEAGAGAAGVDEASLRKRISQLECQNGLLRGEKDRLEVLSTAAAAEAETSAARAAAKIERFERDISGLKEREETVSAARENGDRAKMMLQAMEAKLSELRRELSDFQSKAKEGQELRQRLRDQVAESENLRKELEASRERCEEVEAGVRASEACAGYTGVDSNTKELLSEMENLYQEKLLADDRVNDMQAEIERLRVQVASSAKLAAEEQHAIIAASKLKIKALEEAFVAKEEALGELQASLDEPRDTAAADTSALKRKIERLEEVIEQKNVRITRLESVRLTQDQLDKLSAMKQKSRKTAAENKGLKQRLAELEQRIAEGGSDKVGGAGGSSQDAALVVANDRVEKLQGVKSSLMERCKQYGERIYELERQQMRVRAALEKAGVQAPEDGNLSDAVLEVAERAAGAGDVSVGSSMSTSEAADVAPAVAASDRQQEKLNEVKAALRKEVDERLTVQEKMSAGVLKYRALEANVSLMRQQLAAVRTKEKDHERQIKYLQKENLTLYQENANVKAEADKCKAELKTLNSKLLAPSQAVKEPASATKEGVCSDKSNVSIETRMPSARESTPAKRQHTTSHTTAAERRVRARALLEESPSTADEEAGECKQS